MSKWLPAGNGAGDASATGRGRSVATVVSGGAVCSTEAAQQAHVHRRQNAGQPLSGADSVVPIAQVSGTTSEVTPLASAMSTASTAIRNARRILVNIPIRTGPRERSQWRKSTMFVSKDRSPIDQWLTRTPEPGARALDPALHNLRFARPSQGPPLSSTHAALHRGSIAARYRRLRPQAASETPFLTRSDARSERQPRVLPRTRLRGPESQKASNPRQ